MSTGDLQKLRATIEAAFERRAEITPSNVPVDVNDAIGASIGLLDSGQARVAEKVDGKWVVNEWLKKAVLLYFRSNENVVMEAGYTRFL
jgi:2,3,4,5-tetrahydropyridine-2,6-dicarboxylate N-succinyltransferase